MRFFVILLFIASIPAHSLVAQSSAGLSDTGSVRKQIEANEQAIGRAIHARDFSALQKFWAPQMVVNSPGNKVSTRDEVITSMKDGTGLNYSSLKGTTESFTVFGDIAVEMGHEDFVMATGAAAGKPLQPFYRRLATPGRPVGTDSASGDDPQCGCRLGVWLCLRLTATPLALELAATGNRLVRRFTSPVV